MRRTMIWLFALSMLLSGCRVSNSTNPEELQPVTLAMGFVPNVQFTPVYVAIEKGYFAAEGIDITLDYGMETDLLQRLATDDVEFAIASGDQVILARGNDLPVRAIYNWYQRFPVCVVSLADSKISQATDLTEKTIGIPGTYGASYIGWLALLQELDIDENQVDLQTIGYTQVASLTEDRVDAAICYIMNEPVQLQHLGHDVNIIELETYTSLPSNGIISSERILSEKPELARSVLAAFEKGLQDTLDDPETAFEIARQAIPEMDDETAELQKQVLDACLLIWQSDNPGTYDAGAWSDSVDLMQTLGILANPIDSQQAFSNEFLP